MNNIIIDIDNFEDKLNNLILSKKVSYDNTSKYFIYYCNSETDELSNVIIKIPPIRLLYNYSNQNYNQINFPLNPTYSKTKKFANLISLLEDKLQELLNKPKLEWITNLKKIKNIKNIKLNYFGKDDIKIVSNENNISEIKEFSSGSEVELIVHISHLWLKERRIGISYDICQIKYTSLKSILDTEFFKTSKPKKESFIERPKISLNIERSDRPRRMSGFIPSKEMLENQKKLLKKSSN